MFPELEQRVPTAPGRDLEREGRPLPREVRPFLTTHRRQAIARKEGERVAWRERESIGATRHRCGVQAKTSSQS